MKSRFIVLITFTFPAILAQASEKTEPAAPIVYSCMAKNRTTELDLTIRGYREDDLRAELAGAKLSTDKVTFEVLELPEALKSESIKHIWAALKLTSLQLDEAQGVVVFAVGDLKDAGSLQAISVINRWGMVLSKGMYVNSFGAIPCRPDKPVEF